MENPEIKWMNQGEHHSKGEVKNDIIKYILESPDAVPKQKIKEHLRGIWRIRDEKNIRTHLNDLCKGKYIEKFEKTGFETKYDITTTNQLKNIQTRFIQTRFKDIKLNENEKSLTIILKESGNNLKTLVGLRFYIQLYMSQSFFDQCLEKGIKSLYSGAWENHKDGYGYKMDQMIQNNLNECYDLYILDNTNVKMSMDEFKKVIEETFYTNYEKNFPGWLSGISYETINQIIGLTIYDGENELNRRKEFFEETLKICREKLPGLPSIQFFVTPGRLEMSDNSHLVNLLMNTLSLMWEQVFDFVTTWFDALFIHFFNHDRLTGVATDDEIYFAKKINLNMVKYLKSESDNGQNKINSDNTQIAMLREDITIMSEIIFRIKQPLFYCENCKTSLDVQNRLMIYFSKLLC